MLLKEEIMEFLMGIGEREGNEERQRETELEIEVRQCSSMIFNLEKLKKPFWLNWLRLPQLKKTIGELEFQSERDVICKRTKKACVLYKELKSESPDLRCINYINLNRCPSIVEKSSKEIVVKYRITSIKNKDVFPVYKIKQIEE
jgi:hypothetical protein